MKIYIDGNFYPEESAKISVFDHGLLYGDGVFEGIRFYNGRVFKLDEHLARLYDSARAIFLQIPISQDEMQEALLETIRQNDLRDGYVRLVVTRGVGNLGLGPDRCKTPTVIIIPASIALYAEELYQRGLDVVTCATRRVSPGALSPAIKSLNYLNNIMAKIEAIAGRRGRGVDAERAGLRRGMHGRQHFHLEEGRTLHAAGQRGRFGRHHARRGVRSRR